MSRVYGLMLRLIRVYLSIRRRLNRLLPEGSGEIAGVFEHVNFIYLLPTCIAVAFAPEHFFRRFDRVIAGKYPLFSTPAKSVVQMAAVLVTVGLWGGLHVNEKGAVIVILILGVTCPIWSYLLLVIVSLIFAMRSLLPYTDDLARANLALGVALLVADFLIEKLNIFWMDRSLNKMLSLRAALSMLNWRRYLQGAVLFSVYSIVALPLSIAPGAFLGLLGIRFRGYLNAHPGYPGEANPFYVVSGTLIVLAAVLVAYGISWMILRPLAYLLVYTSKYPHEAALRYETLKIQQRFNKIFFRGNTLHLRFAPKRDTDQLKQELTILMARWSVGERALARTSQTRLRHLLEERRALSEDLAQYRIYLDRETDGQLLEKLDRIESGEMVGRRDGIN